MHFVLLMQYKANHANLTPEYAAIPKEMKEIAGFFNAQVLRQISKESIVMNN